LHPQQRYPSVSFLPFSCHFVKLPFDYFRQGGKLKPPQRPKAEPRKAPRYPSFSTLAPSLLLSLIFRAHDTYLPFSFLFVKPPYPLHSSVSCPLVIEGNDASSNHLEYGWNRCCIHSEGIPPCLFCLAPAFSLRCPLIILGKEAS
jgi:hypothetical protein